MRAIVQSVRKCYSPPGAMYLVVCKALDPPKRQYRCYVPDGVRVPGAGEYLNLQRGGRDSKRWVYWS